MVINCLITRNKPVTREHAPNPSVCDDRKETKERKNGRQKPKKTSQPQVLVYKCMLSCSLCDMTLTNADREIVVIVDQDNTVIDKAPRHVMRGNNLIHRATYILVYNPAGELFIQKRTDTKDIYPGCWDVAAGGVVLAGESYEAAAARELAEELGIQATHLTHHFNHYFETNDIRVWGAVFTCCHPGPFQLQAEEIAEGRFLSYQEIQQLSAREPFTPDGLEILDRLQTD